ncbi:MAG: GGDEF domain-containing protein [Leptospirales bacterium]|nr:GGDEF domain-containing protein [Leptospirales bacterium]
MKRVFFLFVISILFFAECDTAKKGIPPHNSIKTYMDIPGVTDEEISAIEALKSGKAKFSYGALLSTEAFLLPDGTCTGYTAELCKFMSELFGINFDLKIYKWNELVKKLDSREIDFTGELAPVEERMQTYGMSLPIAERMLRIFTHVNSEKIKTEVDISGLKIGFLQGSLTAESIRRKSYPITFDCIDVKDYKTAAEMIKSGKIDAFVDESVVDILFEEYDFIRSSIFFSMVHDAVSLTTANPELKPVISVLNKYIVSGGVDKLYELYTESNFEYVKYKLNKMFTEEEKAYIDSFVQRRAAVPVAFEHDNYPVNFYNLKEDKFQGIAVDVLAEIGRLTGIRFEPAASKDTTWAEIYEKLITGEVPMAAQLLHSEQRRNHFIWSAVPYASSYYAIMSKSDYPKLAVYQVGRETVGVMKQSGKKDIYLELFSEYNNLKEYDTQDDCLDALERGEIDLLMASEYNLLTQTNYREKSGFKINIKLNLPMNSHFGFNKKERILCSIIDKAQQFVQTEEIELNWTGRLFDYSKKLSQQRTFYLTLFLIIMFFVLTVIVFVLIKNVRLGKRLKQIASHDSLTHIFNRRYFMEQAAVQISRTFRLGNDCFISIFDLDHFKSINDKYGHLAGDKVLIEIALRIKKTIRPYDLFGRYGGEEFILLMLDINKENVINSIERIRQAICGTPVEFEGKELPVSASFGIAPITKTNDLTMAIKCADEALYQAKKEGRNRAVFYENF